MKITSTNTSQFWIYIMTQPVWDEYTNHKHLELTTFSQYPVKKNDIIFIYIKHSTRSGFRAIVKADSDQQKNLNARQQVQVRVFKDDNLNRYVIELEDSMVVFTSIVGLSKIFSAIRMDAVGYRSEKSFGSKYMKGANCMFRLEDKGGVLLDKLIAVKEEEKMAEKAAWEQEEKKRAAEEEKEREEEDREEKIREEEAIREAIKMEEKKQRERERDIRKKRMHETARIDVSVTEDTEDEEVKDTEDEEVKDMEDEEVKDTEDEEVKDTEDEEVKDTEDEEVKDTEDEEVKDTEDENEEIKEENEDGNENENNDTKTTSEESNTTQNKGLVPIMIVPCEEFKFTPKKEIEYFKHHYTTCNKCDVTNNNNVELSSIIKDADVEMIYVDDKTDIEFVKALDCYYEQVGCELESSNYIKMYHITDDHELYQECLLIAWSV